MSAIVPLEPVDYLVIGHLARDLTPAGVRLGGTSAYAALTARAMGLKVGVVTAAGKDLPLDSFQDISLISVSSESDTTFENIYTDGGRVQYLRNRASSINYESVPTQWRNTSIIHLGPIANEIDPLLPKDLLPSLLGITPQGWMREWDDAGLVSRRQWKNADPVLARANAIVFSREDVNDNDVLIEHMAGQAEILVVTEGSEGAVLYWNGDRRRYSAPSVTEVDATGAGDVFAAAFFIRLSLTHDPWEAARFATLMASISVTRAGLKGIPTQQEVEECGMVVIQ